MYIFAESKFDLLTKESRRQWEQQLYALHIQPILNDMDSRLSTAQNLLINDDRQGISNFITLSKCLHACF